MRNAISAKKEIYKKFSETASFSYISSILKNKQNVVDNNIPLKNIVWKKGKHNEK